MRSNRVLPATLATCLLALGAAWFLVGRGGGNRPAEGGTGVAEGLGRFPLPVPERGAAEKRLEDPQRGAEKPGLRPPDAGDSSRRTTRRPSELASRKVVALLGRVVSPRGTPVVGATVIAAPRGAATRRNPISRCGGRSYSESGTEP